MIEELVKQVVEATNSEDREFCTQGEIEALEAEFHKKFNTKLPEAYKQLVGLLNGVDFNTLFIWPLKAGSFFPKNLLQINTELRHTFSEEFFYFGKMGEELYVYNIKNKNFSAIDYVDKSIFKQFDTAESMFIFMLETSLITR